MFFSEIHEDCKATTLLIPIDLQKVIYIRSEAKNVQKAAMSNAIGITLACSIDYCPCSTLQQYESDHNSS